MNTALTLQIGGDISQLKSELAKANQSVNGFSNQMKKMGGMLAAAFSTAAVIDFGKKALEAAGEAVDGENQLLFALKGRKDILDRLLQQADLLHNKTLFEDDAIIEQQALLAALGRSEDQIKKITKAAVDLSVGAKVDLPVAFEALNKSLSGNAKPLGAIDAQFKGLSKEALLNGDAIKLAGEKYAGFAEAASQAGSGPMKQFEKAMNDITEDIGKKFLPAINQAVTGMQRIKTGSGVDVSGIFDVFVNQATIGLNLLGLIGLAFEKSTVKAEAFVGALGGGGGDPPLGLIQQLEAKIKKVEEAMNKAFSVPAIQAYNEQLDIMRGKLEALKNAHAADKTAGTTTPVADQSYLTGSAFMLDSGVLDKMRPTLAKINTDFDTSKQSIESWGESMRISVDLANEKLQENQEQMMRTANIAQSMGSIIGQAFGEAIEGQKTFAQTLKSIIPEILKLLLAEAMAAIITAGAEQGKMSGNAIVGIVAAAAGAAAIGAMFSSATGGVGGSYGGGSAPGQLPSEVHVRVNGRISGYDLALVGENEGYRRSRVG